jgi:ABC-2 type transport system ATP-binding protein
VETAAGRSARRSTSAARTARALEAAIQLYRGKGYNWTEAAPTLEDVFIQLMGRSEDNVQ